MIRKDWKKQLKRVRDIADKNFTRNEKPEQLSESLVKLEQRIESIKSVCQSVGKKLLACLQLHGVERDKRLKKLPESALSKQLHESSVIFDEKEPIRQTLVACGNVEGDLASLLMSYEDSVEVRVLQPLQTLLERDIPTIMKLRKQVAKQAQEVESLKSRHSTRQTVLLDRSSEGAKKVNQALEDMEEAVNKLELYKDQLATEMFIFNAKEIELSQIFTYLIESQLKYHSDATVALQKVLPEIKSIEQSAQRPVFGCSLEEHLDLTKQPIATVISESITALLVEGLDQEGLFRITGGATKLKKLRAAFDAGMVEMDEFVTDPHCVASVLKLYLRELPEPLLTFDLYDDWAEASQLPPEQRVNAIASILKKMKPPYYENLRYLIQFLSKLADNAEVNKMSPTNLAIVVGPNLLWSRNGDGQNILTTGVQSSIAESMISNAALLFKFGDESFRDRHNKSNCLAQVPTTVDSTAFKGNTNNNNNGDNGCLSDRSSVAASVNSLSHSSKNSNSDGGVPLDCLSTQSRVPTMAPIASSAARYQAQKDFWCRRVDSVSVRSWPERPLVSRRHEARHQSGLAMHESFLRTRPIATTDCGLSIPDDSHMTASFAVRGTTHRPPRVTTLRPSPPKSVHSEMYSTAFALQSLGDVNCSDYLAKVRTLWDSHLDGSKKRTSHNFDMSTSCRGDDRLGGVTTNRQLSLTDGPCHGLLSRPKMTCSDSELGEMTSHVVSPSQPPGGGSASHSQDSSMKQSSMAKFDSSDSLSSDSLGADSAVGTIQSSISGSEVAFTSKGVENPDGSTFVAPKRGPKKTQAPLPPSVEATAPITKVTTTTVTKTPATSVGHDASTIQKVTTTTRSAVAVATEEPSGDLVEKTKTTKVTMTTTTQAKATIATEAMEPAQKSPAPTRTSPVAVTTGEEKAAHQPVGARRSNQFAASQAMLSNVLTGPRKTLLTRPNTVYMEKAKVELVRTAEEQSDDEASPQSKSETNGAGSFQGKTGEEGTPPTQKKKSHSVPEDGGPKKGSEPSPDEMFAAADEIGNFESDEETKDPSPKGPRRSEGRDLAEDQVLKKPERPSKPARPAQSEVEGGSRSSSGTKEDRSGKEAESSSAAKAHSAGTQSSHTGKQPKNPPPEVPSVVPQQPASGGSGARPPKPPPPSIGSRLPSNSAIEEDTYL